MGNRLAAALMVCVLVGTPASARAFWVQSPVSDAQVQAERDFNGMNWMAAGCLLGVVGWFIATQHSPEPPATALVGKSPDYVAQYRDAYKERSKSLASKKALTGCLIGGAASVAAWVALFASASNGY